MREYLAMCLRKSEANETLIQYVQTNVVNELEKGFDSSCVQQKIKANVCMYVRQGFHQVWYQDIVKATVAGEFEDLKFKISEGS